MSEVGKLFIPLATMEVGIHEVFWGLVDTSLHRLIDKTEVAC